MNYQRTVYSRKMLNLAMVGVVALASGWARAETDNIYVSDLYGNSISEYSLSGKPLDKPLISGSALGDPFGMAIMGNDLFVSNMATDSISEYNATTGAPIGAAPFISGDGMNEPADLLLSGDILYVANIGGNSTPNNGSVEEFNALTGAMVGTKPLITGLDYSEYMAISGNNLYVSSWNDVYEYNATTGALIDKKPIAVGDNIRGLAVAGNDLYVVDSYLGTVTEYNATTGREIGGKPLIRGLVDPREIVYFNGDLYVSDVGTNSITEYNAKTGAQVGCTPLITCADDPYNFIITDPSSPSPVPEPSTWALLAAGGLALYARLRMQAARA